MSHGLELPEGLLEGLGSPRERQINEHWIRIDPVWWTNALAHHDLPDVPLNVTFDERGRPGISRATIFGLDTQEAAEPNLPLLIHSLAWGGGLKYRQMRKRLSTFSADIEGTIDALTEAAAASRTDPAAAYDVLYPAGRTRLKYLGPAFFTKFLYFAGGGEPSHPCLILDARTSNALKGFGWDGMGTTGWSASTYVRYCEQLRWWADHAASNLGRPIAADEIERWLFDQ